MGMCVWDFRLFPHLRSYRDEASVKHVSQRMLYSAVTLEFYVDRDTPHHHTMQTLSGLWYLC